MKIGLLLCGISHCCCAGSRKMSQSPRENERKDRPEKRKKPLTASPSSLPAPQKLKDNSQNQIELASTKTLVSKFLQEYSSRRKIPTFTSKCLMVDCSQSNFILLATNHVTFPNYLYPILSQKKHYRNTLASIDIQLDFETSQKEMRFLANCFDQFALLPRLKRLKLRISCEDSSNTLLGESPPPPQTIYIPAFQCFFDKKQLAPFPSIRKLEITLFASADEDVCLPHAFYDLFLSKTTTLRSLDLTGNQSTLSPVPLPFCLSDRPPLFCST